MCMYMWAHVDRPKKITSVYHTATEKRAIQYSGYVFTNLFLPYLETIDVDIVLDVFKGPPEAIHSLGQRHKLWFQLPCLWQ